MNVKKRQKADIRKPDIIKNYHQVILEEGIEGASIGKVARRMDIHPSLIIHYFQNKDNLTVALVDLLIHEASKLYQKLSIQTDDPLMRLRNMIEIFFSDAWCGMTDVSVDFAVLSLCSRNRRVDERIRNMYGILKNFISAELEKVAEAGILSLKDTGRAAEIIMSIYEGYRHFRHYYTGADSDGYRKDMTEAVVAALTGNAH